MGSIGELTAKLQLAQRKIALSLELTRRAGRFYPRLEGLVEQLRLDTFEKNVLLYIPPPRHKYGDRDPDLTEIYLRL
jgi:hypothetical protein